MNRFSARVALMLIASLAIAACHQPVAEVDPRANDGVGSAGEDLKGASGPTKDLPSPDTTPHTMHTSSGYEMHPEVVASGNDTWLYFTSNAMNERDYNIYRKPARGGSNTQITSLKGDEFWPTVSPDGRFLAFGSNHNGAWNIYVMSLGDLSSPPKMITRDNGMDKYHPTWSPNGDAIAYAAKARDGKSILMCAMLGGSMDSDGVEDADDRGAIGQLLEDDSLYEDTVRTINELHAGFESLMTTSFAELPSAQGGSATVPMGDDGYPSAISHIELRTNQGEPLYGMHPQFNPGNGDLLVYQSFSNRGKGWSGLRTYQLSTSIVTVLDLADDRGAIQPRWSPAMRDRDGALMESNYIVYATVGSDPTRDDLQEPLGGDGFAIISLDGQDVRTIPNPMGEGRVNNPAWVEYFGDQVVFFTHESGIASVLIKRGN